MDSKEYSLIAEIRSTLNTKGYLSLKAYSDFLEKIENVRFLLIDVFGDKREFIVEDFYFVGEKPVIKFENFDSIEDVEFLLGKHIYLLKDSLPKTEGDEFIVSDLIGAKIFYKSELFGKLKDVENYPGNDVLIIEKLDGDEILIPSVKQYIANLDMALKEIHLNDNVNLEDDEI